MLRPGTRTARALWPLLVLAPLGLGPSCADGSGDPAADPAPEGPADPGTSGTDGTPEPDDADPQPSSSEAGTPDPDTADPDTADPGNADPGTLEEGPDDPQPLPWPAIVEKDLYAVEDLRGKPLGEVEVETWLTAPADWEGKTLLVHFFLSWSEPCLSHVAEQSLWVTTHPDLVVLGITVEPGSSPSVKEYLGKWGARYAVASCPSAVLKTRLGVTALPHSLLVSSDGIVRWQGYPADAVDPLDDALLRSVLEADRAARAAREAGGDASR